MVLSIDRESHVLLSFIERRGGLTGLAVFSLQGIFVLRGNEGTAATYARPYDFYPLQAEGTKLLDRRQDFVVLDRIGRTGDIHYRSAHYRPAPDSISIDQRFRLKSGRDRRTEPQDSG